MPSRTLRTPRPLRADITSHQHVSRRGTEGHRFWLKEFFARWQKKNSALQDMQHTNLGQPDDNLQFRPSSEEPFCPVSACQFVNVIWLVGS